MSKSQEQMKELIEVIKRLYVKQFRKMLIILYILCLGRITREFRLGQ